MTSFPCFSWICLCSFQKSSLDPCRAQENSSCTCDCLFHRLSKDICFLFYYQGVLERVCHCWRNCFFIVFFLGAATVTATTNATATARTFFIWVFLFEGAGVLASRAFLSSKIAFAAVKAVQAVLGLCYLKADFFFFWSQTYWIALLTDWTEYSLFLPFKTCCFTVSKITSRSGTNFQTVFTSVSQRKKGTLCRSACAVKFSHFANQNSGSLDSHLRKAWCMNFKYLIKMVHWVISWAGAVISFNFFNHALTERSNCSLAAFCTAINPWILSQSFVKTKWNSVQFFIATW